MLWPQTEVGPKVAWTRNGIVKGLDYPMQKRTNASAAAATGGKKSDGRQPHHRWGPKKPKPRKRCCPCYVWVALSLTLLALALPLCYYAYRERYPAEQRCPPENDRFHDHCREGRKHYLLSLDWDCLGPRRAEAMRMALSMDTGGKPLVGIGEVPSWLTEENAAALKGAPCMKGMQLDMACRYCKPTPKPQRDEKTEAAAAAAAAAAKGNTPDSVGSADEADHARGDTSPSDSSSDSPRSSSSASSEAH